MFYDAMANWHALMREWKNQDLSRFEPRASRLPGKSLPLSHTAIQNQNRLQVNLD